MPKVKPGLHYSRSRVVRLSGDKIMRRFAVIAVATVFFALSSFGQVSLEVQGGLNIANLSDPGNLIAGGVWKSRPGFTGNVSIEAQLADRLTLCPGLRFVQKGTKSEWSSSMTGQATASLTNNYLELPLYIKWQVADFSSKLFAIGGPSISYLLSSRMEGTTALYGSNSAGTKNQYKSYDASFDLGLSLQIRLNNVTSLLATGLYSYGFVKISTLGSNEQTRDVRFLIGGSYAFR